MTKVHDLRGLDMDDAYDETQVNEKIKHGDVLIVADGVAVLDRAWPIMVKGTSKVFHMLKAGTNWYDVAVAQSTSSKRKAILRGVKVAENTPEA